MPFFCHKFSEADHAPRTLNDHICQCETLETDEDASTQFGINRKSILTELQYFNICNGALVPDIMHDVLEGLLQYEAKLLLSHLVSNHILHLPELNHIIENIELGYMEASSRPSPIILTCNTDDRQLKKNGRWEFIILL